MGPPKVRYIKAAPTTQSYNFMGIRPAWPAAPLTSPPKPREAVHLGPAALHSVTRAQQKLPCSFPTKWSLTFLRFFNSKLIP